MDIPVLSHRAGMIDGPSRAGELEGRGRRLPLPVLFDIPSLNFDDPNQMRGRSLTRGWEGVDPVIRRTGAEKEPIIGLHSATLEVLENIGMTDMDEAVLGSFKEVKLVIEGEERFTASLATRLAAAKRCADAGYRVGFHFDPIIISDGSPAEMKGYQDVVDRILNEIDAREFSRKAR